MLCSTDNNLWTMTNIKNLSARFNSTGLIKKTFILSVYSLRHMCREIVIFGAEYYKYPHRYGLKTLISELVLKRAFRKSIRFTPLPFIASGLQLTEVKYVVKQ